MWPTSGRGVSNPNIKLLQIASNIPAPRKGSPTDSIFWVGQPHASPVWLAGLRLALSGDIESNPGPIVDYCRFCHIPLFHYCCRENHLCKIPKFPKSCRLCNFTFCNFCCYVSHFCLPLNRYSNPFSHSHLSSNSSRSKHSSHSTTLHNHTTTNQTRQHNSSHLTPKTTNNTSHPTSHQIQPNLCPTPQDNPHLLISSTIIPNIPPHVTPQKPTLENSLQSLNTNTSIQTPHPTLTPPSTHTSQHSIPNLSPQPPILLESSQTINQSPPPTLSPPSPIHTSQHSIPNLSPQPPQLRPEASYHPSQLHQLDSTKDSHPPHLTPYTPVNKNKQSSQQHDTKDSKPQNNSTKNTNIIIIQINVNGINNKLHELQQLSKDTNADIITVQETKLTNTSKSPILPGYTAIRKDRTYNKGGGLLTYVKNDITFSNNDIPPHINPQNTELQIITVHLSQTKNLKIANLYLPPRNSSTNAQNTEDNDIANCFNYLVSQPSMLITGDINAHSSSWYSRITDHRGAIIEDILHNSNHMILNSNTPTRIPTAKNQQSSSPDITTISTNLYHQTSWKTIYALNSDHLPIIITLNTKTNYKLQQNRRSYTNYNKADWQKFSEEIEEIILKTNTTEDIHTANRILTNAILTADKHCIPKGRIKNNKILLPENIRTKISERNKMRQSNPHNPNLKSINDEIDKLIQEHKSDIWKEKLDQHWDHKQNSKILWDTIHSLSNKKPTQEPNRTINFDKKNCITKKQIASAFNKQFINSTKYSTDKNNRIIDRNTQKLQSTHIQITADQVIQAIKSAKNNNSTGPDNINIKHLKHLGPLAIEYLRQLLTKSLNNNIIPHIWKLAKIVPILKPNKDPGLGSSYRPISLLSPIAKTLEKIVLPHITQNIPNIPTQHGFKTKHSTSTALHNINEVIADGFNSKKPHSRTVMVTLDMSKAFDTVNTHILIEKIQKTNIPPTIKKFTANYLKGRKAYTIYQNTISKQQQFKTGVPQGGVLSPILFNIYMSDIPTPPNGIKLFSYADDITTLSIHHNIETAQRNLEPYLSELNNWTRRNNLKLNPDKSTSTLFTLDPSEYDKTLNLHINNTLIPTVKHPKVLGLTFDPKLKFNEHIAKTKEKAGKTLNILKALTSTNWGKQKETIATTYKTITRPTLEYASTIWSPIASDTNINKIQIIQNTALRIATGCTKDTNTQHLHEETLIQPIKNHLQLHASQMRQKAELPCHPMHSLIQATDQPRYIRQTIFHNKNNYTHEIATDPNNITEDTINNNIKTIHTTLVQKYLNNKLPNKILNNIAPKIDKTEESLPRKTRRTLAQLRAGKSPLLLSYKNKIDPLTYPSPLCPLCKSQIHDTPHLFNCQHLPTNLSPMDLWLNPVGVAALLAAWDGVLAGP